MFSNILCLLLKIREVWNTYELDLVNYQNKCRLIRGWDDLFNKVKEHINSVSAMKLSPYYKVEAKCISWFFPPVLRIRLTHYGLNHTRRASNDKLASTVHNYMA